jgi:hypothetical protein
MSKQVTSRRAGEQASEATSHAAHDSHLAPVVSRPLSSSINQLITLAKHVGEYLTLTGPAHVGRQEKYGKGKKRKKRIRAKNFVQFIYSMAMAKGFQVRD